MRLLRVGRILRNGEDVEPQVGAFLGNRVGDFHALAGFLGAVGGLQDVAGETGRDADVAVGQVGNVLRGVEVGDVRPHRQQLGFGLLVVLGIAAVGVEAQVQQHRRDHLVAGVEHGDPALAELLDVLRLEQHRPGVDRVDAERRLDLLGVVADAVGAPQVGHAVFVARVVGLELLHQLRIEVLPVGQLALVQFLERARLDLAAEEVVGRHHHVVAGAPRQQLAFEGLVGVEDVIHRLDAGFLLEIRQGGLAYVVRPVVDMHRLIRLRVSAQGQGDGGSDQRLADREAHGFVLLLCPAGAGKSQVRSCNLADESLHLEPGTGGASPPGTAAGVTCPT
ncbi:hypothetical protein D9M68_466730 [compost metagenome]